MRIVHPKRPSAFEAALTAPIVTPIVASVALAFFPDVLTGDGYYLIALPFVLVVSLILGYAGMFLVCLPTSALLTLAGHQTASAVCAITSVLGAAGWAWFRFDPQQSTFNSIAVGFLCALGVSVTFCYIRGITIRSSRTQPAARAGSA
jgi:hypothetical protein